MAAWTLCILHIYPVWFVLSHHVRWHKKSQTTSPQLCSWCPWKALDVCTKVILQCFELQWTSYWILSIIIIKILIKTKKINLKESESALLILVESHLWVWVHWGGFVIFCLMGVSYWILSSFCHWKFNCHQISVFKGNSTSHQPIYQCQECCCCPNTFGPPELCTFWVCNPNGKALACFPNEKYELG
jgi:hypothetical protein